MVTATIDDLAWIAGTWVCEIWGGTFEEFWTPPRGGSMMGVGRHLENGRTAFMEFLTIEQSTSGLTMWIIVGSPSKGERKGIPFVLAGTSERSAVFENKEHEFPSRISYSWISEGKMDCVLDGVKSGECCHEEFHFSRL